MKTTKYEWTDRGNGGGWYGDESDFYLSWLPTNSTAMEQQRVLLELGAMLVGAPDPSVPDCGEIALIDKKERYGYHYYILRGDFRPEFVSALDEGGFEACVELYYKLAPEFRHDYSDAPAVRVR